MRTSRATAAALAALVVVTAVAACGGSGDPRGPALAQVPMVAGVRTVARVNVCDPGANAYCAIELVVSDSRYRTSEDLLRAEHDHLSAHGWTGANGEIGPERAADSPGHRLHLTYAAAGDELTGIDQNWIKRPRLITLALSRSIFDRTPALAMMLELDSGAT